MSLIDAHAHIRGSGPMTDLLEELDMKLLSICVAHEKGKWRENAEWYRKSAQDNPQRYAWCTAFDPPDFDDPDYAEKAIAQMKEDFAAGAIAVKIWKNVGMEFKGPEGDFVQMDNPIFDPIWEFLSRESVPLIAHIGEPKACWMPLGPDNPHDLYFSNHPQWHMYGKEGFPSHEDIMAARDRVVEKYPGMPFIGAHMASLEYDLNELATRFEKFPHFAVDTTRTWDMSFLDRDDVREFFIKYSGRVMFATDSMCRTDLATEDPEKRSDKINSLREGWAIERRFYEGKGTITYEGREIFCLDLPETAGENIYTNSARRWIPGL